MNRPQVAEANPLGDAITMFKYWPTFARGPEPLPPRPSMFRPCDVQPRKPRPRNPQLTVYGALHVDRAMTQTVPWAPKDYASFCWDTAHAVAAFNSPNWRQRQRAERELEAHTQAQLRRYGLPAVVVDGVPTTTRYDRWAELLRELGCSY